MATGNGTIKSIGLKGGYGRSIVVQHREGYTTLYAHMSKFKKKLKLGDKVYQGDVIGYVGSSGLATGPHLHYEFRLNNKAIDPMRASLPNSMSLTSHELQDFRNSAINLVLQLNVLHRFVKAKIEINSAIGG
jgi:murein DD-endopeptidase MepM/ murein hydrolase activator NlpD